MTKLRKHSIKRDLLIFPGLPVWPEPDNFLLFPDSVASAEFSSFEAIIRSTLSSASFAYLSSYILGPNLEATPSFGVPHVCTARIFLCVEDGMGIHLPVVVFAWLFAVISRHLTYFIVWSFAISLSAHALIFQPSSCWSLSINLFSCIILVILWVHVFFIVAGLQGIFGIFFCDVFVLICHSFLSSFFLFFYICAFISLLSSFLLFIFATAWKQNPNHCIPHLLCPCQILGCYQ